jgi:hypothetical protein
MMRPQFLLLFKNAYPRIPVERVDLLMKTIVMTDGRVSLAKMQSVFNKNSKN